MTDAAVPPPERPAQGCGAARHPAAARRARRAGPAPARRHRRDHRGRPGDPAGVAPGGLRRAAHPGRPGPGPPDPAGRLGGALRAARGGQPPPRGVPQLRRRRRHRLRRRLGTVPGPVGARRPRTWFRAARGRGHLLGSLRRVRGIRRAPARPDRTTPHCTSPAPRRRGSTVSDQPRAEPERRARERQREREPGHRCADREAGPAAHEPGLVAQPARPPGPAPALAAGQPDGRGLPLRRGLRGPRRRGAEEGRHATS